MNTRQFFISQYKAERPKFLSVIRALPAHRLDYKPHERNSSAGAIAWVLVMELRMLVDLVKSGEHHWKQEAAPDSVDKMAAEYETAADELENALASVTDEQWEQTARMYVGDKVVMATPLGAMMWDFLFDAIHHRGQLTAYLRPMGGKVPSVYGPSADSK